ncbi:TolC family protein [Marinomonas ostreistagni]|uniref:TolC family protein n=1 Tax=Marinomonas ostreistagni TaxID=359209 RepID=A0ABS0ZBI3_9GAMM|nr:TolC family protein [Marinomonas ostreistagni]MBJ7551000.1 TolC family protein [Marinomonas ostreistagni]
MKYLITGCAVLLLSGCASQYQYEAPSVAAETMPTYALAEFSANQWLSFGSPDLEALLKTAFSHNWSIAVAAERVRLARLAIETEEANQGISTTATLTAGSTQSANTNDLSNFTSSDASSLSFSAKYEWDLWGKLQAQMDQTLLSAQTSEWDLEAARLTVAASIVKQYIAYLTLQERLLLSHKNLRSAKESYELYQAQFEEGLVSQIDLIDQQETILNLEEDIETYLIDRQDQMRALALLTGQNDWKALDTEFRLSDLTIPDVALNQPAELIRQRPDLKAAEASVKAAFLSKVETELDRWPNLSISMSLRPSDLYDLAEAWTLSLVESISLSLYDNGDNKRAVKKADINETITRINYQNTVISALHEVQDTLSTYQQSLIGYRYAQIYYQNQVTKTQLTEYEWEEGVSDKSDLISAQRSLYNSEASLVTARQSILNAVIAIYQANGAPPEL